MLYFDLRPVFKLRGIENPYSALVKAGISPQSATKILNQADYVFRMRHVEIICKILNCTPNDLLNWRANKDDNLPESHELHKLKKDNSGLHQLLKGMSIEQLNQVAALIKQQQSDK
ncbi:MAG: helix-turn-helix transcriptional regulator [Bacteroidetes bacterium]|nr:helix-turn-helix transcriptional regulator [Bacteroidota bacterium]